MVVRRMSRAMRNSVRRIIYDVTSVVVPHDECCEEEKKIDMGGDGSAERLLRPLEGEEDEFDAEAMLRSFEVYNEDQPSDLDDLDVFKTTLSTVDGDKTTKKKRRASIEAGVMNAPKPKVTNMDARDSVEVGEEVLGFEVETDNVKAAEALGVTPASDAEKLAPNTGLQSMRKQSLPPIEGATDPTSPAAKAAAATEAGPTSPAATEAGPTSPAAKAAAAMEAAKKAAAASMAAASAAGPLPVSGAKLQLEKKTARFMSEMSESRDENARATRTTKTSVTSSADDEDEDEDEDAVNPLQSELRPELRFPKCMDKNAGLKSPPKGSGKRRSTMFSRMFGGAARNKAKFDKGLETDCRNMCKTNSGRNLERVSSTYLATFDDADQGMKPRGTGEHGVRTRARRSLIYRTWCARVCYAFVLCNLVVWIPAWLKLLTIRRRETIEHRVSIFNNSVGLDLWVSTLDSDKANVTRCSRCDNTRHDGKYFGVTYKVKAEVTDYHVGQGISTASYIVLMASYNFHDWYVVGRPAVLSALQPGNSIVDVCERDPMPSEEELIREMYDNDDDDDDTDDDADDDLVSADDDDDDEDDFDDEYTKSRCCLDKPGFVYLVACATPYEYLADPLDFYWQLKKGPHVDGGNGDGETLEGVCVAVDGRCGSTCGADARSPIEGTCVDGQIPKDLIIDERFLAQDQEENDRRRKLESKSNRRRHYDRSNRIHSTRVEAYHLSFVIFVTMSAVGTWISFLAGCGLIEQDMKPTMSCVEAYLAQDDPQMEKKPLLLCAFSISASESPMMIVRNLTGKLMAWVYQRKFVLSMPNKNMDNVFAETKDPRLGFRKEQRDYNKEHANLTTHCEYIDIFQDEGHRVGAYALWDAFVYMVNDSDLRFLECLSGKMDKMTADHRSLIGKETEDGKCLDDELRNLCKEKDIGITEEQIDVFELAFLTFDLLNALGHPAFWRDDRKLRVASFRSMSSDKKAVEALGLWAKNFAKEKKQCGKTANPFALGCPPTEHEGICANVWNGWWCLYDEMGRVQWAKRYDVTKFWNCRLNYFRQDNENVHHDLMFCYSARANPEDVNYPLAPTVLLRGVCPGVFVRLRQTDTKRMAEFYRWLGMEPLSRSMARRCHARVVGSRFTMVERGMERGADGHRPRRMVFIKVKECTPEFLGKLPARYLTNCGRAKLAKDEAAMYQRDRPKNYRFEGEEAVIPLACVRPLRESRGKSGGMNHAMEILNYYLRYESSTFKLLEAKRRAKYKIRGAVPVPDNSPKNDIAACLLFAIFDCRHMAVQGFWNAVVPYFYHYQDPRNPWNTDLEVDHKVAFVQLPQTFSSLTIEDDIFDMRNEYLFRLANNIRSGVGAITSCGTNAVWNYDIKFQHDPLEHRFNEDTMIEDTASSHDVIIAGRKGVYHFERLVLGARKGTTDYLAAVFRWSKGAVQLFWTTFWYPRYHYKWPYAMLLLHVAPMVGCVAYVQSQTLDQCHRTWLASRVSLVPCGLGPGLGIIADPVYIFFVLTMVSIVVVTFRYPRLGAFTVMFENVTYFFSSVSAFFWSAQPCIMCIARHGLPPIFDNQLITLGALWLQLHCALIINTIKSWSPLENGAAPSDQSLLRSQQMYLITAPLHALALAQGLKEGFQICFMRKDASRWGSFDSTLAMSAVKIWVVGLMGTLVMSVIWGSVNLVVYDKGNEEKGFRALGIFFTCVLIYVVYTPVKAMFFYARVIKDKNKGPSCLDRLTTALFGKKTPIRPDYVYLVLWVCLLAFALRKKQLNTSEGIFNGRSRCSIDPNQPGCKPDDLYLKVRNGGKGIIPKPSRW